MMPSPSLSTQPTCDLFCRVIDNYGDIAVCWRLALQLHQEHGWHVRLWVDELAPLHQLALETSTAVSSSEFNGITVQQWPAEFPNIEPASIVIEAFACELPSNFITAMSRCTMKPVWLNLEYLSLEAWAEDFHARPSPHPQLPLTKYFFFPGLRPGTGGVLREKNLRIERQAFSKKKAQSRYTLDTTDKSPLSDNEALWVSLFCYENPALPALLSSWAEQDKPIHCLVAAGKATAVVSTWLGLPFNEGQVITRGHLTLYALPFVPQAQFDEVLWCCDFNFVRGEDSFVRAQWAALPFVWHIYPQDESAHQVKLDSFLDYYSAKLSMPAASALKHFSHVWNGMALENPNPESVGQAWLELSQSLPALTEHAKAWESALAQQGDLAGNLAIFCKNR